MSFIDSFGAAIENRIDSKICRFTKMLNSKVDIQVDLSRCKQTLSRALRSISSEKNAKYLLFCTNFWKFYINNQFF